MTDLTLPSSMKELPSSEFQESASSLHLYADDGEQYAHSFSLAKHDSYGLLDDVSKKAFKLMKLRVKDRQNHKYPQSPMTG
jgi:hypothetical protein